jgi:predicted amidohydrolase YtcJ
VRTLYRNGLIDTPVVRGARALLVADGEIAWIGADDRADQPVANSVVDLAGATVTAAFVDAHVHTTATGLSLTDLDLSGAASLAEALELVERAARAGRGRPVIGGGWDDSGWPERRPPTAAELDRAGYGGLVYLARVDAHSAAVSSALLAAVPDLAGQPGYRPDGWLSRAAHDAARAAALTALGSARTAELQRTALRHAASLGIACVHEMAGPAISSEADLAGLLARPDRDELPEVIGYWGELFGIDTAQRLGAAGAAGDLFCDGSLGSRTAALHEPYLDEPGTRGMLRFATADLARHIVMCTRAGLQAGFHAIGDAAVDQVIEASELAATELGRSDGLRSLTHRIEHAEFVHDPDRLARTGLHASVQPVFDAAWGGPHGMYAARLGPERATRLNPFAALAAAGVPLALGSDAPVTELGPWAAVRAAVHPHQASAGIGLRAAFTAHTRAGWQVARRPDEGVLRPGAPATFALWRAERPDATVPALPDVSPGRELPQCLATVRRGVVIHDGGALAG